VKAAVRYAQPRINGLGAGMGDNEREAREDRILHRVRAMVTSGGYADHAEVESELTIFPEYSLVREWFKDKLFCHQIDSLCAEARGATDL
jgi:hypothetical protein